MEDSQEGNVKGIETHKNYVAHDLTEDELAEDLDKLLDRYRASLSYYQIMGVLQDAVCFESNSNTEWSE